MNTSSRSALPALWLLFACTCLCASIARAALINFDNCLSSSITESKPLQLQWIPLWVDAKYSRLTFNLNVTIYGNVSGQQYQGTYPPPSDPQWNNPNETFGKIVSVGTSGNYTTLLADFKVLTYDAYNAKASQFCPALINASCPLGPSFDANDTNPYTLPAFSVAHDFGSTYSFSSLVGTIRVLSGDDGAPSLACITTNITPDLGPTIKAVLTWVPAVILILKGVATLSAAIWSPWGSSDIFRWSSNYGRDEDQLRLVTPGFGDCLQYIQFVTLTGALSLQYPGFYQPAVSQTSWSLLLFNESWVSHGNGTQSLVDGIYTYNGTYGMTAMSQLIGMTSVEDIWACMAIWLLIVAGAVALLCQLGFFGRWVYRTVTNTTEEDLRQKNLPFTLGNMIRLLFNYFILPIVSLSLFQLVISPQSPGSVVACAVVLLIIMIVAAGWILRVIFTTKPRTYLFDDMPTVLLYGPLYNTYSDSAAPFALVPVFITFMRAVALGAIQPSGIGQIIVLAICEVILIITLNGFRPFQNQTNMNTYHTFFAVVRLITVLLSIAFVPSIGVSEASSGWIAYTILILHASVLVFGFFLNSLQTLIEVTARSFGVGGDAQTGAVRGSIINWRMLKKRQTRPATGDRGSMTSNAAILQDPDARSAYADGRSRSMSASSQQLLNQVSGATGAGSGRPSTGRRISGLEGYSTGGELVGSPSADTDNAQTGFNYLANGHENLQGVKPGFIERKDTEQTFYRPPRPRRLTADQLSSPAGRTRQSGSSEYPYRDSPDLAAGHNRISSNESGGAFYPGSPERDSLAPAYFRDNRVESAEHLPRPDYSVREIDQYYRGPALSDQPTRKLKTGPADPEGPVVSAQSWFQKLMFGVKGKQKEPQKGFEVVRSSRMPKTQEEMLAEQGVEGPEGMEMQTSPPMRTEEGPYRDSPDLMPGQFGSTPWHAAPGAERGIDGMTAENSQRAYGFGYDGALAGASPSRGNSVRPNVDVGGGLHPGLRAEQPSLQSIVGSSRPKPSMDSVSDYERGAPTTETGARTDYRMSDAPSLDPIESVGSIDLPSRFNSQRSTGIDHVTGLGLPEGQDWLRAVDDLQWGHRAPTPARQVANNNLYNPAAARGLDEPGVPSRNPRRTPSNSQGNVFRNFDSVDGPDERAETEFDFIGASPNEERPSSFATVHQHRANISRNSFGATAALQGTSAEFFPDIEGGRGLRR